MVLVQVPGQGRFTVRGIRAEKVSTDNEGTDMYCKCCSINQVTLSKVMGAHLQDMNIFFISKPMEFTLNWI